MSYNIQNLAHVPQIIEQYFSENSYDFSAEDFPVVLAFQATPVDHSGNAATTNVQYCFSFLLLPTNPVYPDELLHVRHHKPGKIDDEIEKVHKHLLEICTVRNIRMVTTGTHGDRKTAHTHNELFQPYESKLRIRELATLVIDIGPMKEWICTDYLHGAKAARRRVARYSLAESDNSPVVQAENLQYHACLDRHFLIGPSW
jgi:hypothetical protein